VWYKFTDVSEGLTASALMIEAVNTFETRLHSATSQKTAIFILTAVRT
jgi:hypothetical protein